MPAGPSVTERRATSSTTARHGAAPGWSVRRPPRSTSRPYRPETTTASGTNGARKSTGRPETTATTAKRRASTARTSMAPSRGRASAGTSTIGDSVPSKSSSTADRPGRCTSGASAVVTSAGRSVRSLVRSTSCLRPFDSGRAARAPTGCHWLVPPSASGRSGCSGPGSPALGTLTQPWAMSVPSSTRICAPPKSTGGCAGSATAFSAVSPSASATATASRSNPSLKRTCVASIC